MSPPADRLVLSYAPMVKYLACRKVRELPAHCELDDLVSCGLLALIGAVDRFDPAKGATFEQYAWTRVSGAIMDGFAVRTGRRGRSAATGVRSSARESSGRRARPSPPTTSSRDISRSTSTSSMGSWQGWRGPMCSA